MRDRVLKSPVEEEGTTPEQSDAPGTPASQRTPVPDGTPESKPHASDASPPNAPRAPKRQGRRIPYFMAGTKLRYSRQKARLADASLNTLWNVNYSYPYEDDATELLFIQKIKQVISKKLKQDRNWLTWDPTYVIRQVGDECYLTSVFQALTSLQEFRGHFHEHMRKLAASLTKGNTPHVRDLVESANGKLVLHRDLRNALIDMMSAYQYQTTLGSKLPKSKFDNGYAHRLLFAFLRLGYLTRVSFCSVPSWIVPEHHILPGFVHLQIMLLNDSSDADKPIRIQAYDGDDPLREARLVLSADLVLPPVEFCQRVNDDNVTGTRLLGGILGLTPGYDDMREDWAHYVTFRVEYATGNHVVTSVTWFDTTHPAPLESFSATHLKQLGGRFVYDGADLTLSDASRPCHVDEMILFYSVPENPEG